MAEIVSDHPPVSAVASGLACRCPRCGQGKLFRAYLKVADRCAVCGLDLSAEDSGDGPAVFVMFIIGSVAALLVYVLEFVVGVPYWATIGVAFFVVIAGTLALLPLLKSLMIALQFKHKAGDTGFNTFQD